MRILLLLLLLSGITTSYATEKVYYGGLAFVGNFKDFKTLYPYSYPLTSEGNSSSDSFSAILLSKVNEASANLGNMEINTQELANLKDGDAVVLALAIDGESTSTYHVGSEELGIDVHTITGVLSAQILVFDYQSKTIVSSYPILLRVISATQGVAPSHEDFASVYQRILFDDSSEANLLNAFIEHLPKLDLARKESRRVQVGNVSIEDKSDKWLPQFYLEDKSRLERLLGRNFTKYLADNTGANVLPYIGNSTGLEHEDRKLANTGAAIGGAMAMRFSDGEVFNLNIPKPDYTFDLSLRGFGKSAGKENAGGESWIYSSYLNIKLTQPALGKAYFDENLKNVFIKVLVKGFPASKDDDWASLNEATMGLFDKLTQNFTGRPDRQWAKAHGSSKTTFKGLKEVVQIIEKCK